LIIFSEHFDFHIKLYSYICTFRSCYICLGWCQKSQYEALTVFDQHKIGCSRNFCKSSFNTFSCKDERSFWS